MPSCASAGRNNPTGIARSLRHLNIDMCKCSVLVRSVASSNTPESTGKDNFPHDLEKGALQHRGAHISKRRRKKLDGELKQANTSA